MTQQRFATTYKVGAFKRVWPRKTDHIESRTADSRHSETRICDRDDIRKLCEFQMKHRGVFRSVFTGFPRTDDGARVAYLNDLDLSKTMAKLDEHKEQIEDGLYLDISTILHRRFKEDA